MNLTLFRGDSVPKTVRDQKGRTFPDFYKTEGLMARSCQSNYPADLFKPLAFLVAAHIGYEAGGEIEARINAYSPFLSFAKERDHAWHFLDRTGKKEFEKCPLEQATHFLWRLDLDLDALPEVEPGCYEFVYRASTRNVDRFRDEKIKQVNAGDESAIISAVVMQLVHGHVAADMSDHRARVIDPVRYLASAPPSVVPAALRDRAIELARKWSECLIYPMDAPGPTGFSARFTLNDCLDFDSFYRVPAKKRGRPLGKPPAPRAASIFRSRKGGGAGGAAG
jgi:hypothetical protein